MQQALLGGGCFWCVEAVFLQLKGVDKVVRTRMGWLTGYWCIGYWLCCSFIRPCVVIQ